jgi:hypothetical protein
VLPGARSNNADIPTVTVASVNDYFSPRSKNLQISVVKAPNEMRANSHCLLVAAFHDAHNMTGSIYERVSPLTNTKPESPPPFDVVGKFAPVEVNHQPPPAFQKFGFESWIAATPYSHPSSDRSMMEPTSDSLPHGLDPAKTIGQQSRST